MMTRIVKIIVILVIRY